MHFLAMGGYGRFVWSAYGVSVTAIVVVIVLTLRRYHRAIGQLLRLQSENKKPKA